MEWIKNQPVFFGQENPCHRDEKQFLQIIDNTDKTQFQLLCEPCISSPELIPSPDFSLPDGWAGWVNAGSLCGTSASGTAIASYGFSAGYYKIILTVSSIGVQTTLNVEFDTNLVAQIKSIGTFEIFALSANIDRHLKLTVVGDGSVCLSYTAAYEVLTNLIIPIYTKDGVLATSISYLSNPTYFKFVENSVTVTIDWAELGLSNNCFYMCLLDPCVNHLGQNYPANIRDGNFNSPLIDNWGVGGGVSQVGNTVVFTGLSAITQDAVFNSFHATISVIVTVVSVTGNVIIRFGENIVSTITTSGVHIVSGIPSGDFSLTVYGTDAVIDSVLAKVIAPENYVCDATSKLMRVGDYSNDCTLMINMCNNENGLGFVFENSGFTPRIRLKAKLKHPFWKTERSIYDDSRGKRSPYYGSNRQQFILAIDLQPDYIHNFLAQALIIDNFYIDNKAFHVEDDEYNIEYSEIHDFIGQVKITVGEKTQNIKNTNCSDAENICILPPNYLLQTNLNFNIVQTDGFKIIING